MTRMTDQEYGELAAKLTDPDTPLPAPDRVQTGPAASAAGHALLLQQYGSKEAIAAAMGVTRGRPRVGRPAAGPSPTVRGRISDTDYAAFKKLEQITGRTQSELVREAVHRMLTEHKLVS